MIIIMTHAWMKVEKLINEMNKLHKVGNNECIRPNAIACDVVIEIYLN